MKRLNLLRDERGATVVELAFALPTFIVLLWGMVQLGLVYRANSGIQHSLGQGARFATLYPTPSDADIEERMNAAVYGIGPGTFNIDVTDNPTLGYKDLSVTYTQDTNLIMFPGPTFNLVKNKRVWVAGALRGTVEEVIEEEEETPGETGGGSGGTDTGGTDTGGTDTGGTDTGGTDTGGTDTGGTDTGGTDTGGTDTGGTDTGGTDPGTGGGTTTPPVDTAPGNSGDAPGQEKKDDPKPEPDPEPVIVCTGKKCNGNDKK